MEPCLPCPFVNFAVVGLLLSKELPLHVVQKTNAKLATKSRRDSVELFILGRNSCQVNCFSWASLDRGTP